MANLYGQIVFAINKCFFENVDKHSYKEENGRTMSHKIFSYEEKFRIKDVAKNFTNFLKHENINVKQIKDVKPEYVQKFLNSKINCTQNTVNSYASSLFKIQCIVNKVYTTCNVNWRDTIAIPIVEKHHAGDRGVDSAISRSDYNKILAYAKENPSQSAYALRLQNSLGIRVEELARIKIENIDFNQKILTLDNTKGGKVLTRHLDEKTMNLIKEIVDKHYSKSRLFSIEGSSINKYLNRIEDKLSIKRHSNHDIRRLIGQEKFDSYRKSGMTQKEAINEVSKWLSHGDNRKNMLEKSYIKIW